MKSWMKYTIATTVFVAGVGGSIVYNQYLAPYLTSTWVLVASRPLSANAPLEAGSFVRERLPNGAVSPGAIENEAQVSGNYTVQAMVSKQQLTIQNVQPNPFAITKGYEDVPIPSNWIAAVSQTIRQGDYVSIVPLSETTALQSGSVVMHVNLNNILVLSVHTQNNEEVTTQLPSSGQTPGTRDNGTGTPSNLDLKMTTAQAQLVASAVARGEKLFVLGVAK